MIFLLALLLFALAPLELADAQWDRGACERVPSGGQPLCPSLTATPPAPQSFVQIQAPVTGTQYITTSNTILLTGGATCASGTPSVSWVNNQGGSGTMSGTTSWSMTGTGAVLTPDRYNVITVSLNCGAGVVATDQLTVAYSPAELIGAYAFDETVGTAPQDSSGKNNDGSFGAGVAITTTAQKYGAAALDFSGGSVSVSATEFSQNIIGGFSIVAWVRPAAVHNDARSIAANNFASYLYATTTGGSGCASTVPFGGFTTNAGVDHFVCGNALPIQQYSCVALTYNGTSLDMYINKTLINSASKSYEFPGSTSGVFEIGSNTFNEDFDGEIDEVRVYKYGISSAQVTTDCDTQIGSAPPAPATGLKVGSVSVRIGDKDIKLGF